MTPSAIADAHVEVGSIRHAEPRDLAALEELCAAAHVPVPAGELVHHHRSSHLLVLDVAGAVRAAIHVIIDAVDHGRLQLLIVDASLTKVRRSIEARMVGVATALCEAFGCRAVDIA